MKKFKAVLLTVPMLMGTLVGCSQAPEEVQAPKVEQTVQEAVPKKKDETKAEVPKSDVTLTIMDNMVGVASEAMQQACADFTAETGIQIEYIAPGSSYEEVLKTKMASQDLPDLWTTHGWSVARYSEYLRPINDQPFAVDIVETIKPLITDEEGNIFVLPVDTDLAGIVYNKTVLDNAGINVEDLKTWEAFEEACQKVKDSGVTPLHFAGKDSWTIGQYFDYVAPSMYITNENQNERATFKDGTFDWSKWDQMGEMLERWNQSGFINVDALTSDYLTAVKNLAEGKVAFEFYGNYAITEALAVNPTADLGMMPIPAKDATDEPTLIGGERLAIGVWKDSEYMDEALQFLNYFARPDVCAKLATANGMPAGLKGVESDTGSLKPYYEKYANVRAFSYFDREYLPSGMWDDLCITGANILANQKDAVVNASSHMKQSFNDKFSQK